MALTTTQCPRCGRENRSGAGFCAWCGDLLPTGRADAPPERGANATMPPSGRGAGQGTAEQPSGKALGREAPAEGPSLGDNNGGDYASPWAENADVRSGEATPEAGDTGGATEPDISPERETSAGRPTVKLVEPEEPTHGSSAGPSEPSRAPADTAPLVPGTMIADRFEIVELVESSPDHNRYRARDLMRCATCGYEGNAPDDAYCAECGASLQAPAYASILEQVHVLPEAYDAHFAVGRRDYYVSAEPARDEVEPPAGGGVTPIRLAWGRATDPGQRRDHNEDYMEGWLYTRASGGLVALFIVADGLGGQDSGEVASKMATDAIWVSLRDTVWQPIIQGEELEPDTLEERVAEAVRAANRAVYEERIARGSEMSTTLTMSLIVDTTAYVANVGDSRTYLWNAAGLQRITRDHSLVQRLVDAGQLGPEDVYTHPQRNLIYKSIGDRPEVQVDTFRRYLAADDRLILCSDGLWEMVHDDGLEEVLLSEPDPQTACDRLVQNANLAGGEDNITVIIVRAQRA